MNNMNHNSIQKTRDDGVVRNYPCDSIHCMAEWDRYASDEGENVIEYNDGGFTFVHCDMRDCHDMFFHGENGGRCESYFKIYCEDHINFCNSCGKFYCMQCAKVSDENIMTNQKIKYDMGGENEDNDEYEVEHDEYDDDFMCHNCCNK